MAEIYLVRHGQPQWSQGELSCEEPGLTPLGAEHAKGAGQALGRVGFTHFFASPLRRAQETAHFIAPYVGLEPQPIPWWREYQAKPMDQRPLEEVQEYFRLWQATALAQRQAGPPGGESLQELVTRVQSGLESLLLSLGFKYEWDGPWRKWSEPSPEIKILLVGHTFASAMGAGYLRNLEPNPLLGEQLRLGWGAYNRVTTFPLGGGLIWRLREVDSRSHLGGLPNDL